MKFQQSMIVTILTALSIFSVAVELSLAQQARTDYQTGYYPHMVQLERSLYSYSRLAGLKSTRGDSAGAIADLERAVALGKAAKQPSEGIAWAEWQLGMEHFAIGDLLKAESCYRQSLQTYPNYYRALAGMAQLRTAQKSYDEAIDFYQKAIAILPMPDYAAALGDIYAKTGRDEQ